MNYKYEIINYDKNIPAKIMYLKLSSNTHKTELHWHREPELVYVVDGIAECKNNGKSFVINQNDCYLFNSEDVHMVRPAQNTTAKFVFIQFSLEYMRVFCKAIDNVIFNIDKTDDIKPQLISILKKISGINYKEDEYSTLLQIANVNYLYYLLIKHCLCYKRESDSVILPKRDFSYAKTAISYINENYKREISLGEISSVVNLSPSYFSKYFKNIMQVSFSDYLANLRLEYAVQDMINRNSTVSAAALDNGFANVKSFITQCKKVYACTPAQYKKKLLNK